MKGGILLRVCFKSYGFSISHNERWDLTESYASTRIDFQFLIIKGGILFRAMLLVVKILNFS